MTLYLIAHKVRGAPAFDIAERMDMGDDEAWWIIPTSGHRAYPFWSISLQDVTITQQGFTLSVMDQYHRLDPNIIDDLPDHYAEPSRATAQADPAEGRSLLNRLGLLKPKEPIKRRV